MDANWESVTDELIRQLERKRMEQLRGAVPGMRDGGERAAPDAAAGGRAVGAVAGGQAYLRHIRRADGDACRCDVCAPVNDLIGQIDHASEGES